MDDRYDWVAAQKIALTTWEPPTGLSLAVLGDLGDLPRLPLMPVVRLLAFGHRSAPERLSAMQEIASRARAARALLAAAQTGSVELFGRLATENAPKKIDAFVFDVLHSLVSGDDTAIEPDLSGLSMERFAELRAAQELARRDGRPPPSRWVDVHVERASLSNWLATSFGTNVNAPLPRPNLKAILGDAIQKNGAPLTTRAAEKIASEAGSQENQKEVRKVLRSIQGPQKQGPRGQRARPR